MQHLLRHPYGFCAATGNGVQRRNASDGAHDICSPLIHDHETYSFSGEIMMINLSQSAVPSHDSPGYLIKLIVSLPCRYFFVLIHPNPEE
jgi:hypothetical protein